MGTGADFQKFNVGTFPDLKTKNWPVHIFSRLQEKLKLNQSLMVISYKTAFRTEQQGAPIL